MLSSSRSLFVGTVGLMCAATAAPAAIVSIQGVSITNSYSYGFGAPGTSITVGGERSTVLGSDQRPVPTSQLGVDLIGQANENSFYFLHNDYCVGRCQITSSTTIRFTLLNDFGEDLAGLRFDSLITPGHLALVGLGDYQNTAASFAFTVSRTDVLPTGALGRTQTLYAATGNSDINGLRVEANGVKDPFSNTTRGNNEGAGLYYDWSATPLNVELGAIADRQTIYVDYTASYSVQSFNTCSDILNCNAAQVIFGDPRNNGGGTNLVAQRLARAAFADDPTIDGGVHAVITREYDRSEVPFDFVLSDSDPSFAAPAPRAPITYVGNYLPSAIDTPGASAVPEPATWVGVVLGFGAVGGALRRRRSLLRRTMA